MTKTTFADATFFQTLAYGRFSTNKQYRLSYLNGDDPLRSEFIYTVSIDFPRCVCLYGHSRQRIHAFYTDTIQNLVSKVA